MPDMPPRGVIVLCPPLGREYTNSHSTFSQLAARLTQLGFAALRFDYRSTGDSFDRTVDGCEGGGFARDIGCAVDFARKMGAAHVGIVGMRLGASFAGVNAGFAPVDALVLWDPCLTGRSFLRAQQVLGLLIHANAAEESVDAFDLPGFKLSPEMADEICALDFATGQPAFAEAGRLADKVLLLTRSERAVDRRLAQRFDLPHIEHREVTGQPALLEVVAGEQIVPAEGLTTVATWLDKVMSRTAKAIVAPTNLEVRVRVSQEVPDADESIDGGLVIVQERAVWLGSAELFGIETQSDTRGSGPVCIFVSVAAEHRIGPGRLWVELSRHLAADGFRCVRIDVNGFGDSPAREGRPAPSVFSVLAIDDILETAQAISPENPSDVVLFGLCSSGYHALEAALTLSPRGICIVNPSVVFRPPEMVSGGAMDDRRRFCLPQTALVVAARQRTPVKWIGKNFPAFTSKLRRPIRTVAWQLRGLSRSSGSRPGERLGDLIDAGTDVLLICNSAGIQPFLETGTSDVHRGQREGRLQIEVIPTLEHSLLPSRDRDLVTDLVINHVRKRFRQAPDP
jgi:pimeloyl-ACP methyl ester carboxylesterase